MINFIVCEDNEIILQKNLDIINRLMFNNILDYKIFPFKEYNDSLKELINNKLMKKIYILDIELSNTSGIDIAREIRNIDKESFILISTVHTEYLPYTLKSKLLIYEFISKFDDYEDTMINVLKKIISYYPESQKLIIKLKGNLLEINYDNIISVKYDNETRKTIIYTIDGIHEVSLPLKSVMSNLDSRFIKKNGTIINTHIINDTTISLSSNKIGVTV